MELNKILIGLLVSIVVIFGFVFLIAEGVTKYHPSTIPSDYNETFVSITDNLASMINITGNSSNQAAGVGSSSESALSDFIGFFFGQGYKAIKILMSGVDILNVFVETGVDNTLGSNPMGEIVKTALLTIIVVIILALLLHFVIKSDRI